MESPEKRPYSPLFALFTDVKVLRDNWKWFLIFGILLVILGGISIGAAVYTTLFTVAFLGFLLLFAGISKFISSLWIQDWSGFFPELLAGIFYALLGFLLIYRPVQSAAAITLLIGALFVVSGVFKIFAALILKFDVWGWILLSGIVSLILGVLVLEGWPESSLWVIGLFIGIDLIFYGWTWIMLSIAARPRKIT